MSDQNFNVNMLIDHLIAKMGMQNEPPDKLEPLKQLMYESLRQQIFEAAAENIEPEVIEIVMEDLGDEDDPYFIIQELLQASPGAQMAMLEALETFKENTLEAFNALNVIPAKAGIYES